MKLTILCVGKIKDKSLLALAEEYEKRISRFQRLEIIEIKDSNQEKESTQILKYVEEHKDNVHILLDERGKIYTSTSFADTLKTHEENSEDVTLIIAGAEGPTDEVKKTLQNHFALSTMTFTHEMARALLLEQLYRSVTLWNNIPYHKD